MTDRHRSPVRAKRDPRTVAGRLLVAAIGLGALSATFGIAQAAAPKVAASPAPDAPEPTSVPSPSAGPLVIPSVGVVAPSVDALFATPSAPVRASQSVRRAPRSTGTHPAPVQRDPVAIPTPSPSPTPPPPEPTAAAEPEPTTEPTPDVPVPDVPVVDPEPVTPSETVETTPDVPVPTVEVPAEETP